MAKIGIHRVAAGRYDIKEWPGTGRPIWIFRGQIVKTDDGWLVRILGCEQSDPLRTFADAKRRASFVTGLALAD